MEKTNWLIILFIFLSYVLPAQHVADEGIQFSGVVINTGTTLPIQNVNCWKGDVVNMTDALGRFVMNTRKGDTIHFSHVGFKTYEVIVPDTLSGEYMLAVFLTADTVQLGEVLVLRRYAERSRQFSANAKNNMTGVLKDAYTPQQVLTPDQNQKRVQNEFAASTNKGHVNVGFGVGTETVRAYKKLRMSNKYKNQPTLLHYDEIDLLRKIYAAERKGHNGN